MHSCPTSLSTPTSPWPFTTGVRNVILVGGTFDPPHRAHIDLPSRLRDSLFPDASLLFIPAAWSPLKAGSPQTPVHHRIQMLRLACASVRDAAIWTDEIDRYAASPRTPSYTIDTIHRAKSVAPTTNLRLLMGADQATQFHRWRSFREILTLAPPIVLLREPCPSCESLAAALLATGQWSDAEVHQWTRWCVPTIPVTNMSASDLRAALNAGQPAHTLPALQPDVAAYIEQHHLYTQAP